MLVLSNAGLIIQQRIRLWSITYSKNFNHVGKCSFYHFQYHAFLVLQAWPSSQSRVFVCRSPSLLYKLGFTFRLLPDSDYPALPHCSDSHEVLCVRQWLSIISFENTLAKPPKMTCVQPEAILLFLANFFHYEKHLSVK